METKSNVPAIRFKGFNGEWVDNELHQVVDVRSGRDYKHLSTGDIPVFGTGGYMLSVNEALSYDEDAIGIGRKGTIDKPYILKAPFWTVDTLFYTVPCAKNNLDFVYAIFQKINWRQKDESTGVPSLSKVAINSISVFTTGEREQTKIGNYFQQIDTLITKHQQKHGKLLNLKKALLEKMFPKQGATVPEIRFNGFSGKWEEKELGEFSEITTGKLNANAMKVDGEYDFYTSGIKKYKIDVPAFEGQAITIAGNGATVGYMYLADGKFNAYQRTYVLNNFIADRYFLYFQIGKVLPVKISQEARTGNIPYIVLDMLTDLEIILPKKKEQTKIGNLFKQLDTLLTQYQAQLKKLNNIKQACLEKMFV